VKGAEDLVDLTVGLLVVEVVDLQLVDVAAVPVALQVSGVAPHG
jgi:hypothetical protein